MSSSMLRTRYDEVMPVGSVYMSLLAEGCMGRAPELGCSGRVDPAATYERTESYANDSHDNDLNGCFRTLLCGMLAENDRGGAWVV